MASGAVGRRVLLDRRGLPVTLGVAVDALRLGSIGREEVTGEAPGGLGSGSAAMRERRLPGMAVLANGGTRIPKALSLEVVA